MPFIEYNSKKVLFIHIPKTGGTTVERWLSQFAPLKFRTVGVPDFTKCTPQHYRMQDFRQLFGDNYFDYVFTFVRCPYARIESEFRMQAELQRSGFWKEYPSFSLWLEANIARAELNPFHLDNHLRPQWEFLGTEVSNFKMEDGLETGLVEAARVLGVKPPQHLPKELSTKDTGIKVHWDLADRLKVQQRFPNDFERFDYQK